MESNQYLNQKTELSINQNNLNPHYNKNIQIQNFFRGDSNTSKPKNKIYNISSKKEIHFSSRPKGNEVITNGPKILTINFPPEFMISNNNSRKNSSHEKNLLKNFANNFEKNSHTKFANTVNNELEKFNGNNNKKHHQKLILINLNKKEKKNKFIKKNNAFYSGANVGDSAPTGLISGANLEYLLSETELNKRKKKFNDNGKDLEKENGKKFSKYIFNHIKTEGSDYEIHKYIPSGTTAQTNYISDSNANLEKPLGLHNFNRKKKIINSNIDNESNTYISNTSNFSDNSRGKIFNSYKNVPKNLFIVTNSKNKLVFNPSNINQRMKKINSESEYNSLYLPGKNGEKEFNDNIKYYNNINELYNNNGTYNKFKSEGFSKLSSSHEKNLNSHSKEKQHIKTLTEFDNSQNYYESLIDELEYKMNKGKKVNVNSAIEYNKNILENFSIKKKLENINIGIAYKIHNGYKFYFNLPNEQIYILKEVSYSCGKGLISQIELWNKKYLNDSIYLKIYHHEINFNQRQIIWVIQYPTGGESINDIINSVGFYDQNYLFDLVTKIYKSIIKLKEDKECEKYRNVPFCICDIFINVNEHIKIIPPLIRKIPIDSNLDKKQKNNYKQLKHISQCKCKDNLKQILYYFDEDSYSFFCLGFAIIQTITQNLIFDMSSYKYILNLLKKSKKAVLKEHCCFIHLLLNIEKQHFNNSKYLLFSHFLNLYPKSLLSLLHECTNFDNNIPSSSNEFLNLYDTNKNLNLSIKEILDITTIPENKYIKFDTFLNDFEILFKDIEINPEIYLHKLNSNKVPHVLSRAFGLDKELFKNKIKEKIGMNSYMVKNNKNKEKINTQENEYLNEENGNIINFKNDNISSLFIGYNKNRKEINDNMFNKQKNSHLKHNYIHSSENYDYK